MHNHKYLAQSAPTEGKVIRRTIEVEGENNTPLEFAESQANSSVLYGIGAILLVVIAIGAIAMFWKNK